MFQPSASFLPVFHLCPSAFCLCSTYVYQLSASTRAFCFKFSCQHSACVFLSASSLPVFLPVFSYLPALCLCSSLLCASAPALSASSLQKFQPSLCAPALSASSLPLSSSIFYVCISQPPLVHANSFVISASLVLPSLSTCQCLTSSSAVPVSVLRRLYRRSNHSSLPTLQQRLHQFNSMLPVPVFPSKHSSGPPLQFKLY